MAEVHVVTPSRCADAVVDIIFVHGLGGDKVSTWQSLESEESFWPAWLGEDLQHAAIYSLGYDASPSEWLGHAMPLSDRAMNVLALLDAEQFGARPIVFICHSLGGLLIKQLLRTAATLGQPSWQRFARCTKSVVFLATPHAGARLANYAGLLGWVLRTSSAVQDLQANDAHLRELSLWYSNSAQSLNIVTHVFFETQDTKGVRIVDETSANPGISGAIPVPVDADHLSICKPANREALIYKSIRRLVSQYANPQPAPTESLDGTGTVTVADTPTAELTISSLAGRRRVRPLSGHPVLSEISTATPIYTGGAQISFTLAHNGAGKQSINLHALELELLDFTRGSRSDLAYEIEGTEIQGAGVARPHVFSISLRGNSVGPATWVTDAREGRIAIARSANFFDTEEARLLTFSGDRSEIEELQGTVLAQEAGLYEFRFVFYYSVGGSDRQHASEPLLVYFDE